MDKPSADGKPIAYNMCADFLQFSFSFVRIHNPLNIYDLFQMMKVSRHILYQAQSYHLTLSYQLSVLPELMLC